MFFVRDFGCALFDLGEKTMDFETYDCDRCGGNLTAIDSESYKCQYCGKIFHKKDTEEKSKSFKDPPIVSGFG